MAQQKNPETPRIRVSGFLVSSVGIRSLLGSDPVKALSFFFGLLTAKISRYIKLIIRQTRNAEALSNRTGSV